MDDKLKENRKQSLEDTISERDLWIGLTKTEAWSKFKEVMGGYRNQYAAQLRKPAGDIGGVLQTEYAKGGLVATEMAIAYPSIQIEALNEIITLKEKQIGVDENAN
jgi:hypothetical protein